MKWIRLVFKLNRVDITSRVLTRYLSLIGRGPLG